MNFDTRLGCAQNVFLIPIRNISIWIFRTDYYPLRTKPHAGTAH